MCQYLPFGYFFMHLYFLYRTIFSPLWLFHAVVARGRFSLPAPAMPHDRHWAPCHTVVATPLLVAFEVLLCIHLESIYVYHFAVVNLKVVFLPLLAIEMMILIDNFRMCRAKMPGDEENMSDEAIWETLPMSEEFRSEVSMDFDTALLGRNLHGFLYNRDNVHTSKALRPIHSEMIRVDSQKSGQVRLLGADYAGDVGALGWWDLFINFGIAECFAFLVCTKWSNPVIHGHALTRHASSSSATFRYLDWNGSLTVSSEEDPWQDRMCGLQDIGGHIMKVPLVGFQILLCMHLEGTPPGARRIPLPVVFFPLFLLQGVGVLFASSRLVEKIVLLRHSEVSTGRYFTISSRAHDCFGFLHHGSRLLGWWSIDEGSREEQARLYHSGDSGYNTFSGYPPETVKKLPKKELAEEIWRLQVALGEQTEITKYSQQAYEKLQNEKVLCRVCFEREIGIVLLPCRHRILCSTCSDKCKKCPVCRVVIDERLPVYDV
ncbi:hypothetical protein GIB67_038429 [Kingdonia uniflora]|uniref:RING-type domain-containing protein n=1 Tax=Kingdonia uniflora TaxID=39325 RepID=A0A7J7NPQ3_9MAGN|nr:hypothetical protein GIB67_038429 [Kingdonia uniflora]